MTKDNVRDAAMIGPFHRVASWMTGLRAWSRALFLPAMTFVVLCYGNPALAEAPVGCSPPPPVHEFNPLNPNLGELKLWLLAYRCSKYDIEVTQVLAEARAWVEQRASEVDKPAVVLDIDETSLSNWDAIHRNDFAYIPAGACDKDIRSACGQRAWELSAMAVAVEPTLGLYNAAKAHSVAVFFITGRYDDPVLRTATEENLRKAGYRDWNELYLRPRSTEGGPVAEYKKVTRAGIEAAGYTIIANIGDQDSDLADGYAEKTFKVPNPFYFVP